MSNADELLKLKELLDNGVLSEEEFQIEKEKILGLNHLENISYQTSNLATDYTHEKNLFGKDMKTKFGNYKYPKTVSIIDIYKIKDVLEIKKDKVNHYYEYQDTINKDKKAIRLLQTLGESTSGVISNNIKNIHRTYWSVDKNYELESFKHYKDFNFFLKDYEPYFNSKEQVWCRYGLDNGDLDSKNTISIAFDIKQTDILNELILFNTNLFKKMKDNSSKCPKCGNEGLRSTYVRCFVCRWRYTSLAEI